jgi:hypothetical protein
LFSVFRLVNLHILIHIRNNQENGTTRRFREARRCSPERTGTGRALRGSPGRKVPKARLRMFDRSPHTYPNSCVGHQSLPTSTRNVNISRVVLPQRSGSSESMALTKAWLVTSPFAILWIQKPFGLILSGKRMPDPYCSKVVLLICFAGR